MCSNRYDSRLRLRLITEKWNVFINDDEKAPLETFISFFIRETFISPKQATSFARGNLCFSLCRNIISPLIPCSGQRNHGLFQIVSRDNWQFNRVNKQLTETRNDISLKFRYRWCMWNKIYEYRGLDHGIWYRRFM